MARRAIAAFVRGIGLVAIGAFPMRADIIDIGVAVVARCRMPVAVIVLPASGDRDNSHRHDGTRCANGHGGYREALKRHRQQQKP